MAEQVINSKANGAGIEPQLVRDGERTNSAGKPVLNKLLLSISDPEYHAIRSFLEFVELPNHYILHDPNERMKFAYFLNHGLASIVVSTSSGRDVEAGLVGREGVVGVALAVGLDRGPLRVVIQIDGNGFRIAARELQTALQSTPGLQMKLSRYAVLQGMQIAQTAACNRLHDLPQRLARWLLMAQDRLDSGTLLITHDFLATMLGTDRPSVTLAAGRLQRMNAIVYSRGKVEILSRNKLEGASCSCYLTIQSLNGHLGLK